MRWSHCFRPYRLTGNFSSPARFGSRLFFSCSPTSVAPTCSASCTLWSPSRSGDDQPRSLPVGPVRFLSAGVLAFRETSLRGKAPSPPQLGSVRLFQPWARRIRRSFLDRMGTGIATESRMGRSVISHPRGNSDSNSSSIPVHLGFCDSHTVSRNQKDPPPYSSRRAA